MFSALQEQGYEIDLLDIRPGWRRMDLDQLEGAAAPGHITGCRHCGVDSELGMVQPVAGDRRDLKCTATPTATCMWMPRRPWVRFRPLWLEGMDTMSLTAHKFYGPNGIGVLVQAAQAWCSEPLRSTAGPAPPFTAAAPPPWPWRLRRRWPWRWMRQRHERRARVAAQPCALTLACAPGCKNTPGAHQQPGGGGAAHSKPQRGGGARRRVPAGADGPGRVRVVKSACSSDGAAIPRRCSPSAGTGSNALSSWRISLSHLTTEEETRRIFDGVFDACCRELTRHTGGVGRIAC